MNQRILIGVAWPYANTPFHLGHLAGAEIPPDILARYHRLRGNQVLMISGSDTHGTPITLAAEQRGITPIEVVEECHRCFIDALSKLGISFDLYTHTETENHYRVTIDIFNRLLERGFIYKETIQAFYDTEANRFLSDRYVEGICPFCNTEGARGDQCDACGKPLDALQLIDPHSKLTRSIPEVRDTEHFFIDLAHFNEALKEWVADKTYWRSQVLNFTLKMLDEGLRGRAITRDIDWGIPVPVKGYEHKRIYVWFDAVIGYLSASIEWSANQGSPDAWRAWWDAQADCRSYYFIGKDNTFFHTLIWPAILMGYGDLQLPYDVPANEFLTLEGRKISSSRNWAVWAKDYLERYDPDPLRYYLTAAAPETSDLDFTWQGFYDHNNNELVATWGNLANRMLSFCYKNYDQRVSFPGELDEADREILAQVEAAFEPIGQEIEACRFRNALGSVMALAREANRYLDAAAPWKVIKSDPARAATICYVALRVVDSLKILFLPFLPNSCQALHRMLGYDSDLIGQQQVEEFTEAERSHLGLTYRPPHTEEDLWRPSELPAGQALCEPAPLYRKLDPSIVEEELVRLGVAHGA
ncbi:MAG: methionine--tRNA ligase [Chloroflexi bacterium]|nr:methionine--tRNA ligase [Chloroflexota bacterium]